MGLPKPVPGLVIRYSYLWAAEQNQGREEGVKDRPCAIILAMTGEAGELKVTVLPITHTPPSDPATAVEIPVDTKRRLGLDEQRSWIMLTEANRFIWPGPDLRLGPSGDAASVAYGLLPRSLFKRVQDRLCHALEAKQMQMVSRTH